MVDRQRQGGGFGLVARLPWQVQLLPPFQQWSLPVVFEFAGDHQVGFQAHLEAACQGLQQRLERFAVLQAAQGNSIAQGSASHSLLENWLQQNPKDLDTAWFSFMESLIPILKPEDKESLRQTVVDGSIAVAESAGGLMGTFCTVCKEESELIDRFKKLFSK